MPRWFVYTAHLSLLFITGCAVTDVHRDQANLRTALVTLCSNQVMDNLVRASNGLPIIHLDYTNGNTQVTMDVNASLGETAATNRANTLLALTMSSALVARSFTNTVAGGLGMAHTNQVGVTATPVTTNNQLYDAYLSFLTLPGSLVISDSPPPKGAAHICQQFRDQYYWVPTEFRDQYFELATITNSQRGKTLLPPESFFSVTLDRSSTPPGKDAPPISVLVEADKPVPIQSNGQAEIEGIGRLQAVPFTEEGNKRIEYVSKRFYLVFDTLADTQKLSFPVYARLYLDQQPPALTTKDLLERIPFRTPQASLNPPSLEKSAPDAAGGSSPLPPSPDPDVGEDVSTY